MTTRIAWIARGGLAAIVLALAPAALRGEEPAQAFLDALRERGYHDMALEYLAGAANNPLIPAAFKDTLLYEKGLTLVQGARFQRDAGIRDQQLAEAQKALEEFIATHGNHLLAIAARSQLGNVIVEQARSRMERAKKVAGEKQKLHQEARNLYDQAAKAFAGLVEELREKLKAYPAALDEKRDARRIAERDQYRQDYLQAQLLVAAAREEMADTLEKGSRDWTSTLTTAADQYKQVYENYRTRMAGLYARMYQGRCLVRLGKYKDASALFTELLANDDSQEEFRKLKLKVLPLAIESWLAQELFVEVINRTKPLVDSARPSEDRTEEMMAIRLGLARACKGYLAQIRAKNPRDPQVKQLLDEGRKQVTYVARFPGEYQEAARRLMPDFSATETAATSGPKEPKTFVEAKTAAKEAIEAMQAADLLIKALEGRVAAAKADEKAGLQKQLDEARQQSDQHEADAFRLCRVALRMADKESDPADVNLVRYFLSYLLYNAGNFFDSAVVAEFVARRYPDSQGARACAKIAMAGYLKLYGDNQESDKEFESAHIVSIADYIAQKWPDQPEAVEALNTLIPFMIRARQLDKAQEYLARIPADSPFRGGAELKTGQAMWASYLEGSRELRGWESGDEPAPEGVDLAARKAELEQLKAKAKETLVQGVDRMQKSGEASQVMATAVLSLAQLYTDTGEAAKAVQLLEDPKVGVLTLVRNNDPITQREGFPEETYRTALRAYISSLAGAKDGPAIVQKARGIMESLKQQMAQTPEGQQKLVGIYVSLARDLQRQMEIADPSAKRALGLGFETFLKEVAADATELNILNWVAETYRGMGESFGTTLRSLTPESKGYFQKAAETYQKILDRGQASAGFLTPAMASQIRIQLAKTKKSMGDYIAARNLLEGLLKENPMLLPAQVEAARLYQDWGGTGKGQEENYRKAIVGDRPGANGRNAIWGWGEIARMTAGSEQFRDQFYEARYNLAHCRYHYALAQTDATKRKDQLQSAKRDISLTSALYPDLGGDKWKPLFDTLLKRIQQGLGEPPVGLAGLRAPATAAGNAKSAKTVPTSAAAPAKK